MSTKRTKSGQFTKQQDVEVLKKSSALTTGGALKALAEAQAAVGQEFAGIAADIQGKITELGEVTRAVEIQRAEAERIHGVEAIALSIEEATQKFEDTKAEFNRQEQIAAQDSANKLALAQSENARTITELMVRRNEEQAAWKTNFELAKQRDQNTLAEETRVAHLNERIRKEDLDRSWALREAELKAKEQEFVDLRAKVAAFPEELKKEVASAKAIVAGEIRKDFTHQIESLQTSFNAEKTVLQNTVSNLTRQVAEKDEAIKQLTIQVAEANKRLETIANKALETAGNVKALADLQQATQIANTNGQKRA